MIRTVRACIRTLAFSCAVILGAVACGSGSPSTAPSSSGTGGASPSADATPTPTAPRDVACDGGSDPQIWRTHLDGPLTEPTQAAGLPFVLVGDGTTLRSLTACEGERAGSFDLDGPVAQRPVGARLASGDYAVFVTTTAGTAYAVAISGSGELTLAWTRVIRRGECPEDRIAAAPAVQVRASATSAFRSTYDEDVVYVATEMGCGDGLANQVTALSAVDGDVLWTFNETGHYAMGGVGSAPVLDPTRDRLLVGTAGVGPTLYAINVLTGARAWSVDAGPLGVSPVVADDRIFTADQQGNVRAWSATAEGLWTVPVSPDGVQGIADLGQIGVVDSAILVSAGGQVWPITYAGVGSAPLMLPDGDLATTAPVAYPAQSRSYVGSAESGIWQLDQSGMIEGHRDLGTGGGPVCCAALVTDGGQASLLVATASGDLAKLAVPFATVT